MYVSMGSEELGCRARLKGRRVRWAWCMSVAHAGMCVLGSCTCCWQCSDIDYRVYAWDAASSIEMACIGSAGGGRSDVVTRCYRTLFGFGLR